MARGNAEPDRHAGRLFCRRKGHEFRALVAGDGLAQRGREMGCQSLHGAGDAP
ncbi:hypothetical protein [Acetobacter sp. DsW_063]|uniref:hypothetical protein n=1 Tax=Acetobacter sp. DsW_063 TaxID=1514894 RepID=UPI001302C465|nr:hypothetical protein [Acetobacter sp. DsW_063]